MCKYQVENTCSLVSCKYGYNKCCSVCMRNAQCSDVCVEVSDPVIGVGCGKVDPEDSKKCQDKCPHGSYKCCIYCSSYGKCDIKCDKISARLVSMIN